MKLMTEEQKTNLAWWAVTLLCIILLMCSCSRVQYIPVETVRVDSTVVRDSIFTVQLVPYRDSVSVDDTTSYLSNPYAYSRATWSGCKLHHVLGIWPRSTAMVKVPYFIDRYVRVKVPEIVEVERKLTRWQRIYMDIGKVTLWGVVPMAIIIVGWLVYKRRKR